jgi:hypothetical protein
MHCTPRAVDARLSDDIVPNMVESIEIAVCYRMLVTLAETGQHPVGL